MAKRDMSGILWKEQAPVWQAPFARFLSLETAQFELVRQREDSTEIGHPDWSGGNRFIKRRFTNRLFPRHAMSH